MLAAPRPGPGERRRQRPHARRTGDRPPLTCARRRRRTRPCTRRAIRRPPDEPAASRRSDMARRPCKMTEETCANERARAGTHWHDRAPRRYLRRSTSAPGDSPRAATATFSPANTASTERYHRLAGRDLEGCGRWCSRPYRSEPTARSPATAFITAIAAATGAGNVMNGCGRPYAMSHQQRGPSQVKPPLQ
jgi:hypothetical protein